MDNIWVTSDLHLMHSKSFLWQPRGFSSTEEMCEAIVERWNSVVDKGDMVYNLGDIALSDTDAAIPYLQRLNGYQVWLRGNHDTENRVKLCRVFVVGFVLIGGKPQFSDYCVVLIKREFDICVSNVGTE